MRFLAVTAASIAIAVCVAVAVLAILRFMDWRRRYLESRSRWVDVVTVCEDATYVSVQRVAETITGRVVLDVQHMGFVHHRRPDWNEHLRKLRLKAWDRAIDLNQPSLTE